MKDIHKVLKPSGSLSQRFTIIWGLCNIDRRRRWR